MPRTPGETVPSQFRLKRETIELLDALALLWGRDLGLKVSRTDAVRIATRHAAAMERDRLPVSLRKMLDR